MSEIFVVWEIFVIGDLFFWEIFVLEIVTGNRLLTFDSAHFSWVQEYSITLSSWFFFRSQYIPPWGPLLVQIFLTQCFIRPSWNTRITAYQTTNPPTNSWFDCLWSAYHPDKLLGAVWTFYFRLANFHQLKSLLVTKIVGLPMLRVAASDSEKVE